jgi:hypothetical protein
MVRVMPMKIDPRLIQQEALQKHGIELTEARAAELAREVDRLNGSTAAAAEMIDLNDDPTAFVATLRRLARE